jgi:hypothetical protein
MVSIFNPTDFLFSFLPLYLLIIFVCGTFFQVEHVNLWNTFLCGTRFIRGTLFFVESVSLWNTLICWSRFLVEHISLWNPFLVERVSLWNAFIGGSRFFVERFLFVERVALCIFFVCGTRFLIK